MALLAGVAALAFVGVQPDLPFFVNTRRESPEVDPAALKRHVRVISTEIAPRDSEHPENLAAVAAYISDRLREMGLKPRDQKYEWDGKPYKNVVARVEYAGPADVEGRPRRPTLVSDAPLVVVGAHYDSAGELPAADDNASGVAALLELARLLAKEPAPVTVELVAYANEEPPYFQTPGMGSLVHARSLKERGIAVRAMLSLETVGYYSDEPWSQDFPFPLLRLFYPSTGNFIAVVGNLDNRALARAVRTSMRSVMKLPAYSINAPVSVPGIDYSDHWAYWDQGYPGVMITDTAFNRNKAYHTGRDTPDRLDYARMAEVVAGVYTVVVDLGRGSGTK